MANQSAFNLSGSTPKFPSLTTANSTVSSKLSAPKALNPILQKGLNSGGLTLGSSKTGLLPGLVGRTPGLLNQTKAPEPTTPVKSQTTPDGTKIEYHAPTKDTSAPTKSSTQSVPIYGSQVTDAAGRTGTAMFDPNTGKPLSNPSTPIQPAPAPLTVAGQIPGVLNAGQRTANEIATQEALQRSGQATQMELDAIKRVEEAKRMQNAGALGGYAEAGMNINASPEQLYDRLVTSPDLAGRAGASKGLYNTLGDIYGSAATQGLLAANTIAGRGAQTAQGAFTGAQAQAGRALDASQTALGAVAPVYGVQYGTQVGQPGLPNGGLSDTGQYGTGPAAAANVESIKELTGQKNQIQSIFNGADANFKLLIDTARQGGVNDTNVPLLNAIQQNVARGLASDSAVINFQNTLAAVRSQYAQILGGGTTTVDSQNRAEAAIPQTISLGALQSLEQQLRAEATNRVAGISQQINSLQGSQSSAPTGGGSGGGGLYDF